MSALYNLFILLLNIRAFLTNHQYDSSGIALELVIESDWIACIFKQNYHFSRKESSIFFFPSVFCRSAKRKLKNKSKRFKRDEMR